MDIVTNDIIILIYNKLVNTKDIYNFIIINKYFYNLLKNNFNKLKLEYYLNKNYICFYKYLQKYNYNKEILNNLFIKAIHNILTVWSNKQNGFYDMRYIFELMYKGCVLNDDIVKNYNLKNNHFYKHFYFNIINCIVYNNRKKTINNINNSSNLTSLKQNFKYYKKKDYDKKEYIPLIAFSEGFK